MARARVNGGAARTRRRIRFLSSVARRRLRTAPVRGLSYRDSPHDGYAFTRTGRPLGVLRTVGFVRRGFATGGRRLCWQWVRGRAVLVPRPARAFPRRRRVARAGAARACRRDGLACNCQGRALDLRSGVGEWRVASARAAGALKPARAGFPGPLACVPLVAPPASVERRVRLEVVVERISQARHAGPPVGSHATPTRQPAVGLAVPISSGIGSRPVRWRCGPAPICSAIGGAIHKGRPPNEAPGGHLVGALGLFARGGCGQAVETDPQRENRPRAENALRPCFTRPKGRFPIPFCPPLG